MQRNPQLNAKGELQHLLSIEGLPREHLLQILDTAESFVGVTELNDGTIPSTVKVKAGDVEFDAKVRIDTPGEADYYRNGGIMQYVLRNLLRG